MSSEIKRERRVRLGSLELAIALDAKRAEQIRNNPAYVHFVRPALGWLGRGRNGNSAPGSARANGTSRQSYPVSSKARKVIDLITDHDWYQTIELPHGVVTPGHVDHRNQIGHYHLPEDMSGMRVLDVATFDGFWAFEFERRGADVVAIDVASTRDTDLPQNWMDEYERKGLVQEKGAGFRIASELLGSSVRKEICSVYDLDPSRIGKFDMVFCSDLLVHLREPLRAMEAIWRVTDGFAIFADVFNPSLENFRDTLLAEFTHKGNNETWWQPSAACYKRWLQIARFSRVEEKARFNLQSSFRDEVPKVVFHAAR